MTRVAILTFQGTWNVGAELQSFALQEVLTDKFNIKSVKQINYVNPKIRNAYIVPNLSKNLTPKKLIKYFGSVKKIKSRNRIFEEFSKSNIKLTDVYTSDTIHSINNEFDVFIAGSDQTFNWNLTDKDINYLLTFVNDDKIKASYGGSFGKTEYFVDDSDYFVKEFSTYKALGIREQDAVDVLNEYMTVPKPVKVLDPTMLMNKENWIQKFPQINTPLYDKKYICIYTMNPGDKIFDYAKKVAAERNLELVYLNTGWKPVLGVKNVYDFGPIEFLNYIKNSELTLVTSFHGLVFSILFEKQFAVEMIWNAVTGASRLNSVLQELDINGRNITDNDDPFKEDIDYNIVSKLLTEKRQKSINFLGDIVN